jgi:serine protease AprX
MREVRLALCVALVIMALGTPDLRGQTPFAKLDSTLLQRVGQLHGRSQVVITAVNGGTMAALTQAIQLAGGTLGPVLSIINGRAASVPNISLMTLAANPVVRHVALDRPVVALMERTSSTIGAAAVRESLGVTGAGIGVAVIDSGVMADHDDLSVAAGAPRVAAFVDFVGVSGTPYDDNGHGTHVAGIIAGSGFDSGGARGGVAPGAHLAVMKVLDSQGMGHISRVIAALDYVVTHRAELNLRVVNLSIAAHVSESYSSDPLAQATRAAVDQGLVVVAAAGNNGRGAQDGVQYGGIGAPGNAPWVLTVGASSHQGTLDRSDDIVALFSSRGPTAVDRAAKPDLVAPGVGTESLSVPNSYLYNTRPQYLLNGTVATPYPPYLSLSGTSQAAPVVAATVALMLEANPALTPNAVKAILQYTAQIHPDYDALTQGAGLLNSRGAVELARFFTSPDTLAYPDSDGWGKQLVWGNVRITGGRLTPTATAWRADVAWGSTSTPTGEHVAWGQICAADCEAEPVWQTWDLTCGANGCSTSGSDGSPPPNVVWGSSCGGADCPPGTTWHTNSSDGTVVLASDDEASVVVWGTEADEIVVWGTTDDEGVVWGSEPEMP